ncbi:MAG: dTDP-4-dehydrorhamnose 3,5-epimerase family protein [Verrucomicrobiota bacterium]
MKQFKLPDRKRIEGVVVKNLKVIADERGRLMEILRCDDPDFVKFGQVYITTAYPGVVKAWHYHKQQIDNFAVVKGMIKLVLCDYREAGPTYKMVNEFFLGEHNPILVKIPNGVVHGFKGIGETEAIIVNTCTELYDYKAPDEYRIPPFENDIPYDWNVRCDG